MNLVTVLDSINLLSSLAALIILFIFWKSALWNDTRSVLFGVLILVLFRSLSNVLEWSGITAALDPFEDFVELLEPLWWGFFLYAFLEGTTTRDLWDSKKKYKTLLENLPQKIFVKDNNSVYVTSNENYAKDLNIGLDEVVGKTDYDFHPHELADKYRADDMRIMRKGETEETEEQYVVDGNETWVNSVKTPINDEDGNVVGIQGIFWDITERKQAEETLRVSEDRYRRLVENLPDGILVHDLHKYTFVNEAGAKILGAKDPEEIIGTNVLDLVHPDYRDMVGERIEREGKGESVPLIEIKLLKVDGTPFDIEVSAFPVMCKNKMEVYSVVRDITKRKQAEEELKKSSEELSKVNEELKSVDRMKDEFLSNVSHELKTPLVSIEGYSQAMREQMLGTINEQQKKAMDTVMRNAERLERLIDSILYLSVEESGKMKYDLKLIQIADVIRHSVLDMLPMAENRGLNLKNEVPGNLPLIQGDVDKLLQVMDNLIGNAIKFTPSGEITITVQDNDDDLQIVVSDTGIGISQELIGNLFERFYQGDGSTTRRYGGTGLGLHISKLIVEAHNGKIWAESEEGIGTTIYVLLPKYEKILPPVELTRTI